MMKCSPSPKSCEQSDKDGVDPLSPKSVRTVLRRSIELKQQQKNEDLVANELDQQRRRNEEHLLKRWASILGCAGLSTEILTLDDDHAIPFQRSKQMPFFALAIRRSTGLCYRPETGPFRAAQLIVYANCEWQLQCAVVEQGVLASGSLSGGACEKELTDLANRYLTCRHTLCPGLPSTLANVEVELGYLPKPVKFDNALFQTLKSKNCKVWHIPSAQSRNRRDANTPGASTDTERMCGVCLTALRYVERALQQKGKVDGVKKFQRKRPSSNYPLKFLSPTSKRGRLQNQRLQRSRLLKRVNKLYKKTKVELPESQSEELCALIEAIEGSADGQKELRNITKEGNKVTKKGVRAGDCLREVWNKDKESFFRDQLKNGELSHC